MIYFDNLNFLTSFIFIIILFFISYYSFKIYKSGEKNIVFLFISIFLILINIFGIYTNSDILNSNIKGGKILFMLDVSKSMNVYDIGEENISRLDVSKKYIENFINKNPENLYSLGIFDGDAIEVLPFTENKSFYIDTLKSLDYKNIKNNGTNIKSVFDTISGYFEKDDFGTVVIFTDGGDLEENYENIDFDNKNIQIINIGIGTESGGRIVEGKDVWGEIIYKVYNNKYVISKLNINYFEYLKDNFNFDYILIDDQNSFKKIENNILSLVSKINNLNLETKNYLTRILVFISFIFFIVYLISNNLLGLRK